MRFDRQGEAFRALRFIDNERRGAFGNESVKLAGWISLECGERRLVIERYEAATSIKFPHERSFSGLAWTNDVDDPG